MLNIPNNFFYPPPSLHHVQNESLGTFISWFRELGESYRYDFILKTIIFDLY